mgnify:CR=1 FL=1
MITEADRPVRREDLEEMLDIHDEQGVEALRRRLNAMVRDGQLVRNRRDCYALADRLDLVAGRPCLQPSPDSGFPLHGNVRRHAADAAGGRRRPHAAVGGGGNPGAYSSREFIYRMGEYLDKNGKAESFVHEAYKLPFFRI